jgi:hypothetical protein
MVGNGGHPDKCLCNRKQFLLRIASTPLDPAPQYETSGKRILLPPVLRATCTMLTQPTDVQDTQAWHSSAHPLRLTACLEPYWLAFYKMGTHIVKGGDQRCHTQKKEL